MTFHLIQLGGGVERHWFTDNIHRPLLEAVLDVPHLGAIVPEEIAGDAESPEEIAPLRRVVNPRSRYGVAAGSRDSGRARRLASLWLENRCPSENPLNWESKSRRNRERLADCRTCSVSSRQPPHVQDKATNGLSSR